GPARRGSEPRGHGLPRQPDRRGTAGVARGPPRRDVAGARRGRRRFVRARSFVEPDRGGGARALEPDSTARDVALLRRERGPGRRAVPARPARGRLAALTRLAALP